MMDSKKPQKKNKQVCFLPPSRSENNETTKRLLVILGVLIIIAVGFNIWQQNGAVNFIPVTIKNNNPYKVSDLKDEKEIALGTVLYPNIVNKNLEILKNDFAQKITFESQDSSSGVINIYGQDLVNRYTEATIKKKEVRKSDSLNQKAIILTCSSKTGDITITVWPNKNGLTSVEIEKQNSF